MTNENTGKRVQRFVILLSIVIAVVCGIDTYRNYEGWTKFSNNYEKSTQILATQMEKCALISQTLKRKICEDFAGRYNFSSEYFIKAHDFKKDMEQSITRWIALHLAVLILYFGMRWVWTGRIKN